MAALPNSNISTSLVANTLQTSSHDVGYLCSNQHGRTNKWSKHKPVIWNRTNVDSTPYEWYKAQDGRCGFKQIQWCSVQQVLQHYISNVPACWDYNPPTGGASAPYRLGDFRQYDKDAPQFIQSTVRKDDEYTVNRAWGTGTLTFTFDLYDTGTNVTLSDFDAMNIGISNDMRITALIYKGNNLPNTGSTLPDSIQYGTDLSIDHPNITIDFNEVTSSTSACNVVFCLSWVTQNENYLPIPYDDNHYFSAHVNLTNQVTAARILFNRIGTATSTGSTISPLSEMRKYADTSWSSFEYLKSEERGTLTIELQLTYSEDVQDDYVLYDDQQLYVTIDYTTNTGGTSHGYLDNLRVRQINGSSVSYPYTFARGTTHTITLVTQGADVTFPSNLQDGAVRLRLYDARQEEEIQWALHDMTIYVDMSPYND